MLTSYVDNHGNLINTDSSLENIEFPDIYKTGMHVNVDVNRLIREVLTSPYVDDWITDTVKSAVQQYGFEFKVNHSTLLDDPSGSA